MSKHLVALLILVLALAGCAGPAATPEPVLPGEATPTPAVDLPAQCRGDGAAQTWLLLPLDPAETALTTAYRAGQVVEFQARVLAQDDDPARAPHRRFILAEAAEGITVTVDYQGDPPPLAVGQTYRLVAWADIVAGSLESSASNVQALPQARSYGLQIFDEAGVLFIGLTNTDLRDDPLDVELSDGQGECPAVSVPGNPCVASRQVTPLELRWGDDRLSLYPGEDGQLAHDGALYQVSLFRNRTLQLPDPACTSYAELTRSLRIDRVGPPPVLAPLPPLTGTLPLTLTPSLTAPLTLTLTPLLSTTLPLTVATP